MKIVYMGTPDFAVPALRAMHENGYQVVAVVTQPDKQKGRGKELSISPVKACALEYNIPVLQPERIKNEDAVKELAAFAPDLIVVAAFGQFLSEEILNMPRFGCINIHASLLPAYRGAAPIQRAVLNGETQTGVTIQQMAKGMDTGDILTQAELILDTRETGESLYEKLKVLGADLLIQTLPKLFAGELQPVKQKEEDATFAPKLLKDMGLIDWNQDAVTIERLIRGLNSWPSAYTYYKGKMMKIWEAEVLPTKSDKTAGEVTAVHKDSFEVNTGKGSLRVTSLQLEGKKRMNAGEFLLGYSLNGEKLGGR